MNAGPNASPRVNTVKGRSEDVVDNPNFSAKTLVAAMVVDVVNVLARCKYDYERQWRRRTHMLKAKKHGIAVLNNLIRSGQFAGLLTLTG